jgi:ATP-dependent Zn protease
MKRTKMQLKQTAYHEAGHAVIERVLTLPSGGVTIKPDYDEGSWGHANVRKPFNCQVEWEKRGKARDEKFIWHAKIIALMAGAEAEAELLGLTALGDGGDREDIKYISYELAGANWDQLEPRLRAMTRQLVRRHKALIERLAKALLVKTTLSGEEVDKLVGRSVDDVKMNSPSLLEAYRNARTDEG